MVLDKIEIKKILNSSIFLAKPIYFFCIAITSLNFLISGIRKMPGSKFTILPEENPIGQFFSAMYNLGFLWNFIGFFEILLAVALFFKRTSFIASLLMLPISLGIFLITVSMNMRGTPFVTGFFLATNIYVLLYNSRGYDKYFKILLLDYKKLGNVEFHNGKYSNSPLNPKSKKIILNKITSFFDKETSYLISDFNLTTFSDTIKVPKHHISQVLNQKMNCSFSNYLNAKRVEYVVHRMKSTDITHLSMEGLGYEAGFKSKSIFFKNFKRITKKTPSVYYKELMTNQLY